MVRSSSTQSLFLPPHHVAIIPDGNRRFAIQRGLKPWEGHRAGAENTERLIREARKLGIRELSFWGSSLENLSKRPVREKKELLNLYFTNFEKLLKDEEVHREEVRIRIIGRWEEQFPEPLKKILRECMEMTGRYERYFLNFLLAYSGTDDMREAFRKVSDAHRIGEPVTDALIKQSLMTRDMSPVDLLIRTGGEPHLSAGFMMWDIADAQLYFSEANYPDFGPKEFAGAIAEYQSRGRRRGA